MLVEATQTAIKWTELLPVLTPATLLLLVWKARGWFDDLKNKVDSIHLQTTNHIPTELGEQTKVLTSIDKNIAVIAAKQK